MKSNASRMRAAGATALLFLGCTWAAAQERTEYVRLVDESKRYYHPSVDKEMFTNRGARNTRQFLIRKICRGDAPLSENQKEFDAWFKGYYYPLMTDPQQLPELAKLRRELMRDYFNAMKNDTANLQVREYLNKLTLEYLQKFAANNLHPAVRYNAMLIIGDLDSRAAESFGTPKPAEPMFEALEVLQTELTSPTQIDAVRVAALLGLRRHAELNRLRPAAKQWTEAQMNSLAGKLTPLATVKKPPAGRSLEGHVWMRRLSLETLAELAATRPMPAVATLVDRIASDAAEPLDLRIAAAKAQGRLKSPLPMGEMPAGAAEQMARIAVDAVVIELDQLKHYLDKLQREELSNPSRSPLLSRGPGLLGERGLYGILESDGGSGGKEEETKIVRDPRIASTQRRLKTRLENIRHGLVGENGASGLAAVGDKAEIEKLAAAIAAIQKTVDKAPGGDPVLLDDLREFHAELSDKGAALEELLPRAKPVEEPATPEGPTGSGPAADGPVSDGPVADGPATDAPADGPVAEPVGPSP